MSELKLTAFRLSPGDSALIDGIRERTGILSRSDVVRMAIHKLAALEGVGREAPAKPAPRKRSKSA